MGTEQERTAAATSIGFDRHMPRPPIATSEMLYPGWDKLRVCLYRLPPSKIALPSGETLRIVVQLSARSMQMVREMRGTIDVVQPGLDAININPAHQPISWHWDKFMEFIHLQISPAFLAQMQERHGVDTERIIHLERLNLHDALIAQIGHELADLVEERTPKVTTSYLDVLADLLVLHLWNRYCCAETASPAESKPRGPDFHQVVHYIHANLDKDLRVEQIARLVNLSTFYFIRLFKETFGKTPHQYVLDCRTELAKSLLRDSGLPISEISLRCGFSTQSHFTSAFRHAAGQSPRTYRKSHAVPVEPS